MSTPKPGTLRYSVSYSMLPGIQGVCWMFACGILYRAFELPFVVVFLGLAGLIYGFAISTRRFFAQHPPRKP